MGAHVYRQASCVRKGLATCGASVGAVAGMGAHAFSQVGRLRAGLGADRALKDKLAPRPTPHSFARPSRPVFFSSPEGSCRVRLGPTIGKPDLPTFLAIGATGAFMNRVHQPRPLVVLGLNVWMGTAAGADELVEIPTGAERPHRIKAHPLHLSTSLEQERS